MDKELNSAIINSKCMLFLGAGASAPLGLKPTAPFLDLLQVRLKPLIEPKAPKKFYDHGYEESFDLLFSKAATFYRVMVPDSELVLDYLGVLAKVCEDLNNLPDLFRELASTGGVPNYHRQWSDMLEMVSEQIKKVIVEHYSRVDGQKAWTLYNPLLERLCSFGRVLPVFTTNYDWVFESIAAAKNEKVNFIDGFTTGSAMGEHWDQAVFKNFEPNENRMNLALFKLHGSTSWYKEESPPQRILKYTAEPSMNLPGARSVLIYPTQVKDKAVKEDPFKTAYEYLLETLVRTNLCIVIGFSFRDPAIHETFRTALEKNSKLKLIVVEPAVDEEGGLSLDELIRKLGIEKSIWGSKLHIIKKRFGDDKAVYEEIARRASMPDDWDNLNSLVS